MQGELGLARRMERLGSETAFEVLSATPRSWCRATRSTAASSLRVSITPLFCLDVQELELECRR